MATSDMRFAGSAPQDEIECILGELAREERFGLALTDSGRIVITGGEVFEV